MGAKDAGEASKISTLATEYDSIKKLVQHDQYRARLFKLKPVGVTIASSGVTIS